MIYAMQPAKAVVTKINVDNHVKEERSSNNAKLFSPICEVLERIKDIPDPIMMIPGVAENSFGFVFGPPKSGKTTYVETLFWHIAAGRNEFMGNPLNCTNKKCLFISLEEGTKLGRLKRNAKQIQGFTEAEKLCAQNNYLISDELMPSHMLGNEHWDILEEAIETSGASVVAVDSLNRLTFDKNSDEDVAKRIASKLQGLVKRYGITLFIINHTTKTSNEGIQSGSSMRGSGLYTSEAEFLIAVNRTLFDKRYIKLVLSRHDEDISDKVDQFEITENRLIVQMNKVDEGALFMQQDRRIDDTNANLIFTEVSLICKSKGSVEFEISELKHLIGKGSGKMSRVTLHEAMGKLIDKKKVEWMAKGKYRVLNIA
jgi:KaiC/GvpD/RAD55 family RecA-like ATPase